MRPLPEGGGEGRARLDAAGGLGPENGPESEAAPGDGSAAAEGDSGCGVPARGEGLEGTRSSGDTCAAAAEGDPVLGGPDRPAYAAE